MTTGFCTLHSQNTNSSAFSGVLFFTYFLVTNIFAGTIKTFFCYNHIMISNKHARFVNIKGDAVRNFRLNGSSKSILLQVVT